MGEGTVKYADGSVVSLECHEERHGDCPDDHSDGSEGNGSQDGYNCECSCSGAETIAPVRPLQERAPEVAELVAAIRRDGGFGPALEPYERSDVIAELVTQWLDANGYEMSEPAGAEH